MGKVRLLLAEDNLNLNAVIKDYLELSGFEVVCCNNGRDAEKIWNEQKFDLLLLDIMMPHKDGLTLAEDIRKKDNDIPIIFLSARILQEDRIKGFKVGGDDYITKPFYAEELVLRVNSILKRSRATSTNVQHDEVMGRVYQIGNYIFDSIDRLLTLNGSNRLLTGKETAVLKILCQRANGLVMRDEILKIVWGENNYFVGRSMDVFIAKLRKYLLEDPDIKITNLHGAGFRLDGSIKLLDKERI